MSRDNKLLALSLLFWGLGEGLFISIEPLYLRQLGADPVGVGTALALAAAAAGLAHLPAGYLADHLGRKNVLVAGSLLGMLAVLGMFLAPDLGWFVPAMMLYNLTAFILAPLSAYITEARGGQSVQRALTLVFAGFWAGNIISPAVGGWIGEHFGLRYAIGLSLGLVTISTVLQILLRAQPVVPAHTGGARYAPLLRNRPLMGFLILILGVTGAQQVGWPLMPNYLQEVRGLGVGVIGFLGSVNAVGVTLANLIFGRLSRPQHGLLIAQGAMAGAMALLLLGGGLPVYLAVYVLRAGWNLTASMTIAQAGRMVNPAEMGLTFGILEAVIAAAQTLGPLAAGALYQAAPALPFQVSLGLIVITLPLLWWLAPQQDAHTVEAEELVISDQ